MELRIQQIERGLNKCLNCVFYRREQCGAYFLNLTPEPWTEEDWYNASEEMREERIAICLDHKCEKAYIDEPPLDYGEYKAPEGIKLRRRFLAKCKTVLSRIPENDLFRKEYGNEISTAVYDLISQLDFDALEEGQDIMPDIQMIGIEYSRDKMLYPRYSEGLVKFYVSQIQPEQNSHIRKEGLELVAEKAATSALIKEPKRSMPLEVLSTFVTELRIATSHDETYTAISWSFIDGENKEAFTKQLAVLSEMESEIYNRSILLVWDKLINMYDRNHSLLSRMDDSDKHKSIYSQIEDLLISYISAAYLKSLFGSTESCFASILKKLDMSISGINQFELLRRVANCCDMSEKLLLTYRYGLCSKCELRGCDSRVNRLGDILDIVGSRYDDSILKINEDILGPTNPEKIISSATEEFIQKFSGRDTTNFIESIIVSVGYRPGQSFRKHRMNPEELSEYLKENRESYSINDFDRWDDLIKEVTSGVRDRKNDECELDNYINSLLVPFEDVCKLLYPEADDYIHSQGALILDMFRQYGDYGIDDFVEKWKSAEEYEKVNRPEVRSDNYNRLSVIESYFENNRDYLRLPTIGGIQSEYTCLLGEFSGFANVIEGALLQNGIRNDVYHYMDECGVMISNDVDSIGISSYFDWTEKQAKSYLAKYGHKLEKTKHITDFDNIDNEKPTSVSFDNIDALPEEFRTDKAVQIWKKAQEAGFVDENFKFIGKKVELAMFAANLSITLFGKIDWITIQKWNNYKYYAKAYSEVSAKSKEQQSERIKLIMDLF